MIRISKTCIETFPCIHKVSVDGRTREMDGVQIEALLRKHKMTTSRRYAHFALIVGPRNDPCFLFSIVMK